MNKLPKGLRRMTKEDFLQSSLFFLDKEAFPSSIEPRIGVEWNKINKNILNKKSNSLRW